MKIRICNLKNGELLEMLGQTYITQLTDTHIRLFASYEFYGKKNVVYKKTGHALTFGRNCQQFVNLFDNEKP